MEYIMQEMPEQELNAFCGEPESGIRCTMVGKSKVYVKK